MAEPGDEIAAGASGHGRLRRSHADREQVIGVLKAAFVQGRLAKEEFDVRVGQAFASGTYAELAAVTADLPAGLASAQPPPPAWAEGEPRIPRPGPVLTVATVLYAGVWVYAILFPRGGDNDANDVLIFAGSLVYLLLLLMIGTPILADRLNQRFARQLPRRPGSGAGGQAPPRIPGSDPVGSFRRPITAIGQRPVRHGRSLTDFLPTSTRLHRRCWTRLLAPAGPTVHYRSSR